MGISAVNNGPFGLSRWIETFENINLFLDGFFLTLLISFFAIILAIILGSIHGLMSTYKNKTLKFISRVYVEFFQNTPLLIVIFFLYFVVPKIPYIGFLLPPFFIGILGLGVYHGAYISEVVRSGIMSVSKGQFEAARSQGFNYFQIMRLIILPQTIKSVLPPLTNQIINLIKNTSILTVIAAGELMYNTDTYAQNGNFNYVPAYIIAGFLYFIICFLISQGLRYYENKLKKRALS